MQLYPLKLVTIIAEDVLGQQLQDAIVSFGSTGYSTSPARGVGGRGTRKSDIHGSNIRIETVCPESVANKILAHIEQRYFKNYACIVWVSDIGVVRGERYTKGASQPELAHAHG